MLTVGSPKSKITQTWGDKYNQKLVPCISYWFGLVFTVKMERDEYNDGLCYCASNAGFENDLTPQEERVQQSKPQ